MQNVMQENVAVFTESVLAAFADERLPRKNSATFTDAINHVWRQNVRSHWKYMVQSLGQLRRVCHLDAAVVAV